METIKLADAPLVSSMSTSNRAFVIRSGGVINRYQPSYIRTALNLSNKAFFYANAWGAVIPSASSTTKEGWDKVGNYSLFEAYKAECGRYVMSMDGSKAAKLSTENSAVYPDGMSAPVDSNHTMCRFPRLYYHYDGSVLWMSQLPISDKYIEERWIGAYIGDRTADGKLVSMPDKTPGGASIAVMWGCAHNNGAYFGIDDYDCRRLLTFLHISEYGSPNAYHHVGVGMAGSAGDASIAFSTGGTAILGDASDRIAHPWTNSSGTAINDACDVSFMGVENYWGTAWQIIQGAYAVNTNVYLYKGNRLPTSAELTGVPTGDFRVVQRLTSSGLFQFPQCSNGELDIIAKNVGGAGVWSVQSSQSSAGVGFLVGGRGAGSGIHNFNCTNAWSSISGLARLVYYSQPEIVEKL